MSGGSRDYYSGAVTRGALDENLDVSRELFGDALRVFCIDEEWEQQWGRWEANSKFPGGLTDLCEAVRSRGGEPGIWTAPQLANTYSPLFLEHPE